MSPTKASPKPRNPAVTVPAKTAGADADVPSKSETALDPAATPQEAPAPGWHLYLTAIAAVVTIGAVVAFHQLSTVSPGTVDMWENFLVAAATFFVCSSLMALCPTTLTVDQRSRVVSTVHAVVSTYLGALAIVDFKGAERSWAEVAMLGPTASGLPRSEATLISYWTARSPVGHFAVSVTAGYIAYDTCLLALDSSILDWRMKLHHAVALLGFGTSIVNGYATNVMAAVLLNEASTLFINNHATWAKAGIARPLNGLGMWVCWLLCRMVHNSVVLWVIVCTASSAAIAVNPVAFYGYLAGFLALQVLNTLWFYQITTGLLKAVGIMKKPAAKKEGKRTPAEAQPEEVKKTQ